MSLVTAALLIRPRHFAYNAETAGSNVMQSNVTGVAAAAKVAQAAADEHAVLVATLAAAGVNGIVADDSNERLPDAVFPNNWVSFHDDGTLVLYPMLSALRRRERREAVIATACEQAGFTVRRRLDLTRYEEQGLYLEGTGSLVLDHEQRVAYVCRSPRTSEVLAELWAREMGYELCCFSATDAQGIPYYHTNVMMWIGTRCAAACLESVPTEERKVLRARLECGGRSLIDLSRAEVAQFCGNMLELTVRGGGAAAHGRTVLVMSAAAAAALSAGNAAAIRRHVDAVVAVPVPTIERVGGGGVRCMIAELPMAALSGQRA